MVTIRKIQGKESCKENKYYILAYKTNLVYTWDRKRKFMLIFPIQSPSQITYTINSTILSHTLDCQTQCVSTFAASTFLIIWLSLSDYSHHRKCLNCSRNKHWDPCIIYHKTWTSCTITQHTKKANSHPLTSIAVLIGHDRQRFTQCWRCTVIISKWT